MSWTAPRTWTSGEVITPKMLNEHVRDNLENLNSRVDELGGLLKPAQPAAPFATNEQGPLLAIAAGLAAATLLPEPISRARLLRFWKR